MPRRMSRRTLLKSSAAAAAVTVLPTGLARGFAANEKVNVAMIGVMGVAAGNRGAIQGAGGNIVALCDVAKNSLQKAASQHPQAKTWSDYRDMLQKQKDIDAVMVSTPDHTHAPASMMAIKLGKHVATEKPLKTAVPILGAAYAAYECKLVDDREYGDHRWLVGEVVAVHLLEERTFMPK